MHSPYKESAQIHSIRVALATWRVNGADSMAQLINQANSTVFEEPKRGSLKAPESLSHRPTCIFYPSTNWQRDEEKTRREMR